MEGDLATAKGGVYSTHLSAFFANWSPIHMVTEGGFWSYVCTWLSPWCGQLALDGVHHPSWADTSPKKFRIWVKRENPFLPVGWLISGAGPGQSGEMSFRCAEEQSRCLERTEGREHPGFTGPGSNYFSRSMESLSSPFQVKSSYFIMNSLFLPYSNSFSYNKNDPYRYRGYMLPFLSLFFKEKRKVSGEKGWGYRERTFLRGEWKGWGLEHKEKIHFPLR